MPKGMYAVANGAAKPMYDWNHSLPPLFKGIIACGYYDVDNGKRFRFIKQDRTADNSLNPASEICSIDNRSGFAYCASGTLDGKYAAYLNKYSQTVTIKRYDKASSSYMEYSSFLFDSIIDILHDTPSDSFTIHSLTCALNDDFTVAAFVVRSTGSSSGHQCESSSIYSIGSSYGLTELVKRYDYSGYSESTNTEYSESSGVCSMTRDGEYVVLSCPAYTETYPANNKYYSIYRVSNKMATLLKTSSSYLRYYGEKVFKSKDGKNLYVGENIGSSAYSPYLYSYSINSDGTLTELGRMAYYFGYFDELEDGSYALVSHQKYPDDNPSDFQLYYVVSGNNSNGQLTGFSTKADLGSLNHMAYFVDDSK